MSSNVTLKSNIYINKSGKAFDVAFLGHVTDYKVLKRLEYQYGGTASTPWMTPVQKQIIDQGQPNCALERGTMSWGVPVGGNEMVCRCEQRDCRHYSECSKFRNFQVICRTEVDSGVDTEIKPTTDRLPLYNELPQVNAVQATLDDAELENTDEHIAAPVNAVTEEYERRNDNGFIHENSDYIEDIFTPVATVEEQKSEVVPLSDSKSEYKNQNQSNVIDVKVVDQNTIICAGINERIWVNAGPGTGKTYTVIQRLLRLISQGIDGSILVLCFSRNAVQVIRERLTEALGYSAGKLIDDGQLVIRTFDSFASYMLDDELNTAWDYNKRIAEFTKVIKKNGDDLNDMLGYLIVDEIQDTVGVRAKMLLALLDTLRCGVLLLGDCCQAIFDWTVREDAEMTFDELSEQLLHKNFIRYELSDNRRQSGELADHGMKLREQLLHGNEETQEAEVKSIKEWARSKWHSYKPSALPQCLGGPDDLILCKTNGEAAHISQILYEQLTHANHVMKQSSRHRSLAPWIAKVLSGNDGQFISKEEFFQNAENYDVKDPEGKWTILKSLDGHQHAPAIHIRDLLSALSSKDSLPETCINTYNDCVVVSTVHRAKGSEAEHVYWMDSPLVYDGHLDQEGELSDALKASYVAVTRAKKDIHMLNPDRFWMRSVNDTRWIKTGFSKNGKPYCAGIAFLPEDVEIVSFVERNKAEEIQAVLSCIEPGMPVVLYPKDGTRRFEIFFEGQYIGTTSSKFSDDLFAGFEATNHNKNMPCSIGDVYVSAVTTEMAPERNDLDEAYRKAGCWLGIELGGFPSISWM